MMLIDLATGSKELVDPMRSLGVPVDACHLDFGDVAFMGRGEGGAPLYVGIEFKKVGELVGSLITKRFQGHQLLGMTEHFDRRYLLIEGDYHSDAAGRMTTWTGKYKGASWKPTPGAMPALTFDQECINLETRGGLWVKNVTTRQDTLRWLLACYRYWTDKDLDEHKSHLSIYAPDLDKGLLSPPSDFRKLVHIVLPGIGFKTSKMVEDHVGEGKTLRQQMHALLNMTEAEWAEIDTGGKRLGSARAKKIMEALG